MDQLAAMLARAAVPSGTSSTEGTGPAEGMASSSPLLSGSTDLPDREVGTFILLINVLLGEYQLLWDETVLSY
jgi:hypothetical protein